MKIFSELLRAKTLVTTMGEFYFDENGIAEVEPPADEALLQLGTYHRTDGAEKPEILNSNGENSAENKNLNEISGEGEDQLKNENNGDLEGDGENVEITEEYLADKNVPQLKKIAKDLDIDLAGANKKDEIIPIILGSIAQ